MNNNEQTPDKEGLSTRFKITIPQLKNVTFKTCDGLDSEVEVRMIAEGGRMGAPRMARGRQLVSRISFSHGMVSPEASGATAKTIFDWYQEVCDSSKPLEKKTISITIEDPGGNKIAGWKILNAWPCRWRGPLLSSEMNRLTIEQICFAHEGIEAQ
ncbi:MAG: phage tail protein [Bdellovibrionota bacterium]